MNGKIKRICAGVIAAMSLSVGVVAIDSNAGLLASYYNSYSNKTFATTNGTVTCSGSVTKSSNKYTGRATTSTNSQYGNAVVSITMYYYDANGNPKTAWNGNGGGSGASTSVTSPSNVTFRYTDNFHTGFGVTNDFIIYVR